MDLGLTSVSKKIIPHPNNSNIEIELNLNKCPRCYGFGSISGDHKCRICNGFGKTWYNSVEKIALPKYSSEIRFY